MCSKNEKDTKEDERKYTLYLTYYSSLQHNDELTDAKSKKKLTYKDIEAPPGWKWEDDWNVDKQRAVDDKGTVITIYCTQQV